MVTRKTRAAAWKEEQENKMINLNPASPPAATEPHVGVGELLALLDNPAAAKEHLAKIKATHAQERKRTEQDRARSENEHKDKLAALTQQHNEALAKDRSELARERAAFNKECAATRAEFDAMRKELKAKQEAADAEKADYRRRTQRLAAAASETV